MRKSRFLNRVFVSGFVFALSATAAQAAVRPTGVCTPPGAWSLPAEPPTTVVRAWGQFFPVDGKFYLMGGRFDDTAGDDFIQVNIYDPATDSWSQSNSTFVDGQVNNMVGGVLDFGGTSYIVVVGGSAAGATTATADVRQYDPVNDSIVVLSDDPWPGDADGTELPGSATVIDNKLYVFGGFNIGVGMLDSIWQFDPAATAGSRWTQMTATLPTPIGYIPTANTGGKVYLLGGSEWDGTSTILDSADTSVYDPAADTITAITPIPRPTGETRAVTMTDGTIWVLGGGRDDPNPSNEVDIYDPVGDAWTIGPPFTAPRRNFPADIDPASGTIWAVGGYDVDGLTPLSINEQFSPCVTIDDTIFQDGFDGTPG